MAYQLAGYDSKKGIKERRKKDLEALVSEELENPKHKNSQNSRFLPYFIFEELKEKVPKLHSFNAVFELVKERTSKTPSFLKLSPEVFKAVRDNLIQDIKGNSYRYFLPEGLLYLAQDSKTTPNTLSQVLRDRKAVKEMINDLTIIPKKPWNDRIVELPWEDINEILSWLKEKYEENDSVMFKRYGSKMGTFYIADDCKEVKVRDLKLHRIFHVVHNGEAVSRLTKIDDSRFKTQWSPDILYAKYSEAKKLKNFLREIYEQNKDQFYSLFSGIIGNLTLPHELEERGIKIEQQTLSSLLGTPEKTALFLEIPEKEIQHRWTFSSAYDPDFAKEIILFANERFDKNPEEFFNKYYSNEIGVVEMARDYKKEHNRDVKLDSVSVVLRDGNSLARIFDSNDARLKRKSAAKRFDIYLSDLETIVDFCGKEFKKNPKKFFNKYGSQNGIAELQLKLKGNLTFRGYVSTRDISRLIRNKEHLSRLIGSAELQSTSEWAPRYHTLNEEQSEGVFSFLREKYEQSSNDFFERYGSMMGIANLEDDLEETGLKISGFRLSAVMHNGNFLQKSLGIQDERFTSKWFPRSIQVKKIDREIVRNTLNEAYEKDKLAFFVRYGSQAGQYILQQDIKKNTGRTIPLTQLNTILRTPKVVSALTGIPKTEFEGRWNPQTIQISEKQIISAGNYMKELYSESPETFFSYFNSSEGFMYLLARFKNDNKKNTNPGLLCNALSNKDLVSLLVGADNQSFRNWHPPALAMQNTRMFEETIEILKENYSRDAEAFVKRYGTILGSVALARDLKEKGFDNCDLSHTRAFLAGPHIIKPIVGTDDAIDKNWSQPVSLKFYLNEFEAIQNQFLKVYNKDSDLFFKRYGGKTGKLILIKEMGDKGIKKEPFLYSPVLSPEVATAIVGKEDERFQSKWRKKLSRSAGKELARLSYNKVVDIMQSGLDEIVKNPALPENLSQCSEEYIIVRRILRATEKENLNYLIQLYAPESVKKMQSAIKKEIAKDKEMLSEIEKLNDSADTLKYEEEKFRRTIGSLLYSFDEDIRKNTQANLIRIYGQDLQRTNAIREHPEIWDYFSDFCLRYDMYRSDEKGYPKDSFENEANRYLIRILGFIKLGKVGQEISLDSTITSSKSKSGDDFLLHDIIG